MTVSDLIAMLRTLPPDARVVVDGYESGFDDATDERRAALSAVPVIERAGRAYYVRMADIPPPWEAAFRAALRGSACPAIDGEGECAYAWDWHDWLNGSFPR
ncbi:hypothetical protein [Caballeronia grimmiae]|uniref:hypothetical protein n=1 Tax=Caballeronia grimmiae TaxID=1071679 RepID=UPI0038B6E9C8